MLRRLLTWLGFQLGALPRSELRPVHAAPRIAGPPDRRDWNGTVLSTESYR